MSSISKTVFPGLSGLRYFRQSRYQGPWWTLTTTANVHRFEFLRNIFNAEAIFPKQVKTSIATSRLQRTKNHQNFTWFTGVIPVFYQELRSISETCPSCMEDSVQRKNKEFFETPPLLYICVGSPISTKFIKWQRTQTQVTFPSLSA